MHLMAATIDPRKTPYSQFRIVHNLVSVRHKRIHRHCNMHAFVQNPAPLYKESTSSAEECLSSATSLLTLAMCLS